MSKLTYERAKQLYTPYDEGQMRHLCALRDVEIDRLRADNAKLLEERDGWKKVCVDQEVMHAMHEDALDNEIAKLRELAQQMYPRAKAFLQMGVRLGCNDTLSYDWYLQLRDLGVEVDE